MLKVSAGPYFLQKLQERTHLLVSPISGGFPHPLAHGPFLDPQSKQGSIFTSLSDCDPPVSLFKRHLKLHCVCVCVCVYVLCVSHSRTVARDCSPPGFFVHGILRARILEWVAIPFSRGSSQLKDQT